MEESPKSIGGEEVIMPHPDREGTVAEVASSIAKSGKC
jgi:hypothetical protein